MTSPWTLRRAQAGDAQDWTALRHALWPDEGLDRHPGEIDELLGRSDWAAFLAFDGDGDAIGFAEASVRRDYVNGTDTSPVGFLEGWYVAPSWRGRGVGKALVAAVEDWSRAQGMHELASDTWLDSSDSLGAHLGCGFEETERVIYFRKRL